MFCCFPVLNVDGVGGSDISDSLTVIFSDMTDDTNARQDFKGVVGTEEKTPGDEGRDT
jgi:hypothetical protein